MFSSVGVLVVMVLAAALWTGAQYGGNYKEVGADGKGDWHLQVHMKSESLEILVP